MTMHYTESEERYLAMKQRQLQEQYEKAFGPPPKDETEGDRIMRLIRMASQQ